MKSETVDLMSTVLWGAYGLTTGSLGIVYNHFNGFLMVTIVTAAVGNSAHLISMHVSNKGLTETAKP